MGITRMVFKDLRPGFQVFTNGLFSGVRLPARFLFFARHVITLSFDDITVSSHTCFFGYMRVQSLKTLLQDIEAPF